MPTLAVQLASGQEVVSDFLLGADSTVSDVADAAGAQLAVASSQCVLLSPSGDCLTHSLTASATNLADGDVVTVLVMDFPRVYAHPRGWAFAAVKHDGSVFSWAHAGCGGDSESVKSELQGGVGHVVGARYAFSAVKQDGSVVTWGDEEAGGDSNEVRDQLSRGVRHVAGSRSAFAAVKDDGSVVTWGEEFSGGNSDKFKSELTRGVDHVVGASYAFAAVKQDGSVVTWSDEEAGGESDEVRDQLTRGVRPRRWKQGCLCGCEG